MKTYLFTALIIFLNFYSSLGGQWVRYNIAGYDPVRPKKVVVMADNNCTGYGWRLKNASATVAASGTLGASVTGSGNYMPKAFNYEIDFSSVETIGTYTLEVDNIGNYTITISCRPYSFTLSQILRTIRVRRSGSNAALDHATSHLGDASCPTFDRAGSNNGSWAASADGKRVNMLGGYYDAGDYIKFTLTNAYLTYFMLRSYEAAPELFDGVKLYSTTSLDDLLDECKWGLDFLMKTMPDANEFIIQTGGSADHEEWPQRLPENDNLDGQRECYSSFSRTQMGFTAAALALGSNVFAAKGLTTDAANYRNKAIQIYTAAKASAAANAWWEGGGEVYYDDNTYNDNMELAAIELYRLTGTASYLTDAKTYGNAAGSAGWSAWSDINMTAHCRLLPYYPAIQSSITEDLNSFLTTANSANNTWRIPHSSVWGSLYSQFSVAHSAMQYKLQSGSATYDQFGYDVVDYTLGRNAWGLGFIATQTIPGTITSSYAAIYKLQPSKFPYGEIAEGPAPASDHSSNTVYFSPPHNPGLWHSQFNTSQFTFFEQPGDYVSMETTICGLADGLFLMTLATKNFCNNSLPTGVTDFNVAAGQKASEVLVSPNPFTDRFKITFHSGQVSSVEVIDMTGKICYSSSEVNGENIIIPAQSLAEGLYTLKIIYNNGAVIKTIYKTK
ncbi:MAG: glycoside hydrolase family 9 protein [Cytophagaceae bacterium]|nr:glycoside hydrolase family 9 protein [Cytophagaceae bacterium]